MNIIITNTTSETINNSIYTTNNVMVNNKEISITVVSGKFNYTNILVKNAAQRAFNGIGKDFDTIQLAFDNYKDRKIKAAIEAVKNN